MSTQNPYQPPQQFPGQTTGGKYVPCPKCRSANVRQAGFTWWGGALGPRMFTHVICQQCGNQYNGKTGASNATAITIYTVVSVIIGLAIGIALILLFNMR